MSGVLLPICTTADSRERSEGDEAVDRICRCSAAIPGNARPSSAIAVKVAVISSMSSLYRSRSVVNMEDFVQPYAQNQQGSPATRLDPGLTRKSHPSVQSTIAKLDGRQHVRAILQSMPYALEDVVV